MDWQFSNELILRTGIQRECDSGDHPQWNPGHRQSVFFLEHTTEDQLSEVTIRTNFNAEDGDITFHFLC